MNILDELLFGLTLISTSAAATVCLLWQARNPHPLFRIAGGLFACLGIGSLMSILGASRLGHFVPLVLGSLMQAPVLLLLCRVLSEAARSEWSGYRRWLPWATAWLYVAMSVSGLLFRLLPGEWPPFLLLGIAWVVDWVVRPLYLIVLVRAIANAMFHLADCPWPVVHRWMARWWPIPAIISLLSLAGLFWPILADSFSLLVLFASLVAVRLGFVAMRLPAGAGDNPISAEFQAGMDRLTFTPREQEVCLKLLDGWTYADIAGFLAIAPSTVKTHVQNAYRKAGAANKLELARFLRS